MGRGLPAEITGARSKCLPMLLEPLGRADIVEGEFEDAAGDDAVGLILA